MKPLLILTVGLPRSGKNTWAVKQGFPIVEPDALRLVMHGGAFRQEAEPMVWAIARIMVQSLFKSGHQTVILNATSVSAHRRGEWKSKDWDCRYVLFKTPIEECRRRAIASGQEYLLPVIDRMNKELEWPTQNIDQEVK